MGMQHVARVTISKSKRIDQKWQRIFVNIQKAISKQNKTTCRNIPKQRSETLWIYQNLSLLQWLQAKAL